MKIDCFIPERAFVMAHLRNDARDVHSRIVLARRLPGAQHGDLLDHHELAADGGLPRREIHYEALVLRSDPPQAGEDGRCAHPKSADDGAAPSNGVHARFVWAVSSRSAITCTHPSIGSSSSSINGCIR